MWKHPFIVTFSYVNPSRLVSLSFWLWGRSGVIVSPFAGSTLLCVDGRYPVYHNYVPGKGVQLTPPPQWRIGRDFDLAARPNKLRNFWGAGIFVLVFFSSAGSISTSLTFQSSHLNNALFYCLPASAFCLFVFLFLEEPFSKRLSLWSSLFCTNMPLRIYRENSTARRHQSCTT